LNYFHTSAGRADCGEPVSRQGGAQNNNSVNISFLWVHFYIHLGFV